MRILDLAHGYFRGTGDNEVTLVSTKDDPPKYRLGVLRRLEAWGRSLGCHSFNLVRADGTEEEMVLIQGKETEDAQGRKTRGGEYTLNLKRPHTQSTDDAMTEVLTISVERGARFTVPISAPNLMGSASRVTRFYSDDGRFCFNVQGDDGGKIVQYDTHGTMDETQWTPVAQWKGTR